MITIRSANRVLEKDSVYLKESLAPIHSVLIAKVPILQLDTKHSRILTDCQQPLSLVLDMLYGIRELRVKGEMATYDTKSLDIGLFVPNRNRVRLR